MVTHLMYADFLPSLLSTPSLLSPSCPHPCPLFPPPTLLSSPLVFLPTGLLLAFRDLSLGDKDLQEAIELEIKRTAPYAKSVSSHSTQYMNSAKAHIVPHLAVCKSLVQLSYSPRDQGSSVRQSVTQQQEEQWLTSTSTAATWISSTAIRCQA